MNVKTDQSGGVSIVRVGETRLMYPILGDFASAVGALVTAGKRDILIDLSAHLAYNRLLTFARKPAPVQMTYLGYPGTSGLEAIDYTLSDPFLAPPLQMGRIVAGSPTVLVGGQPAASASAACTCCVVPGQLVPSVMTVLVG